MTTSVSLSYDPSKWDFIDFKMNLISIKRIADTDAVSNVTCTRPSVITRVVIRFLCTASTSYDKALDHFAIRTSLFMRVKNVMP